MAKPEQLAAMTPHGSPGLLSLLLREYKECIAGQEAGQGDIQEPEVLPEQIY